MIEKDYCPYCRCEVFADVTYDDGGGDYGDSIEAIYRFDCPECGYEWEWVESVPFHDDESEE
ncbi:MAG: hypothetical protein IH587_02605 [Anaerolineae bacterium]|nr:hypothetical protein [Anaerolineae bacterium]